METILEGLNREQRAAAECVDGPVLIVAGAGSGKTRVLTTRIAWLIGEKGIAPERILALTFTKKAAQEMKERIAAMVGERKARRIWMGTFHSVFIRFLRDYADRLGYPPSFTIYDTSDSQSAIKTCVRQLQLDDKIYKPREVLGKISMAKNGLFTADAYAANEKIREADRLQKKPELYKVFKLYEQTCKQNGVMDFDDILLNMNILLRDVPEARAEIAARFDHILVDEYQDTNRAQYQILRYLSAGHRNLCVVGDDSQSIYAFRGANIGNILNFQKDYQGCRIFRLESNYRSTQMIVNASNKLISKNEGRIPKQCRAIGGAGEKIRLVEAFDERIEATMAVSSILGRLRNEKAQYRDFAIFYRTLAQSHALEEALRTRNIPCIVLSGNAFYERTEVKDLMAYFKLVVNPSDNESFKRIVNKPARGIGETSIHILEEAARVANVPMSKAVFLDDLEIQGLRNTAIKRFRDFSEMISRLHIMVKDSDAYNLAKLIADESGLYLFYKSDDSVEGQNRTANVEELLDSVARFVEDQKDEKRATLLESDKYNDESNIPEKDLGVTTLDSFLESSSLLSNIDVTTDDNDDNKVSLMTVHSSKGLEFPHVLVVGMEENLFPLKSMQFSIKDIEEERRLFYVAMTRAKNSLTLFYANHRMRNGQKEYNPPSRFLRELDESCVTNPNSQAPSRPVPQRSTVSAAPSKLTMEALRTRPLPEKIPDADFVPVSMDKIVQGIRVEHNRFGMGTVLEVTGRIPDLKAKIRFDQYGEKILLLKFAKLRLP